MGIALVNLEGNSNTVNMKLLDQGGNVVATDSLTLAAFAQTAFALQKRDAFRPFVFGSGVFIGSLAVSTADPSQKVAAIVLGVDNEEFFGLPVTSGVAK